MATAWEQAWRSGSVPQELPEQCGPSPADFAGGSTEDLWNSLPVILDLPGDLWLSTSLDYPDDGADAGSKATVGKHRPRSRDIKNGMAAFSAVRGATSP